MYGHFSEDGREYVITNPATPRPWSNIIANPRFGLAVSHTGSGFTWIDNSQLAVVNVWRQDLAEDSSGKFLYARDAESGALWSLSPAPVWAAHESYACHHGLGYTTFRTLTNGIEAEWTLFPHASETVELWLVKLTNRSPRPRRLEITSYLEWCCGTTPAPRREFHRLFIETWHDRGANAVFAKNHMWDVGSKRWGHWNTDFPYVCAIGCSEPVVAAEGEKAAFLGRYGSVREPLEIASEWNGEFGRHNDPISAMRIAIALAPGETKSHGWAIAVSETREATAGLLEAWRAPAAIERALTETREGWIARLAGQRIETPDARFNTFINDWVRYQAISARIWGRCGYYQQSGAYGFRDQLQDSQVWLTIDPARCREQIRLHAAHQFADGSVYHWWHPLSEQGHVTKMTDDLLWLAFVMAAYIRETGDMSILEDEAPYLDDPKPASIRDHVDRAFDRVFLRMSDRGLPYIGAGDWNDGLSAAGLEERGESIWLGIFLAGLLAECSVIAKHSDDAQSARFFANRHERLVEAVNAVGWDGKWYFRATLDDGTKIGSASNARGQIYLNPQTWAILCDVATPDRAKACMEAIRERLVSDAGALLLAPAYDAPVESIGYITRYAPGLRENGGVYTHAATWAIAAAAKVKDAALVERLLVAIDPTNKDPERYWAEPYVLPGNVDGPDSPHHGRAGWTWYTGSAQWLHRVVAEWLVGVRPEWNGLRIDPCLPPSWAYAKMTRGWRGASYVVSVERGGTGATRVLVDGKEFAGNLLPVPAAGARHEVRVIVM
jgi:cellobiose phosphorylase